MDFLKREALKGAVGASVNAAFGQRVLAGDILKGIGTSVLADVLASTGGDLHAEGALTDAGQTAWHMGSGAVVGGLMGGTEGAIAAAGANLVADLAFKGLAPTKPPSLDADEQKAYTDAIDRTAIAAKLLAPVTVMFVTGGSAVATSTAIASSSAVVNENHAAHAIMEMQQQAMDEEAELRETLERSKEEAFERQGGAGGSGLTDAERQNTSVNGRGQYVLLDSGEVVPAWKVADMDLESRAATALEDYRDGADRLLTMAEFTPHPGISIPAALVRSTANILSGNTTAGEAAAHVGRSLIPGPIGTGVRLAHKGLPGSSGKGSFGRDNGSTSSSAPILKRDAGTAGSGSGSASSSAGPSRPAPKAEKPKTPASQKQEQPQLLPEEGRVGTYGKLKNLTKGDDLTPNHMPQNAYMRSRGVAKNDGVAIMMEHPHPGVGGRHRATATYGRKPDLSKNPRDTLAHDVADVRKIYRQEGLYTPEIRRGLREVVEQNKTNHPGLFKKGDS